MSNRFRRFAPAVAAALALLCALSVPAVSYAQDEHHDAEAAEHSAEAVEHAGSPNPLAVDPDLAIWTGVVFLLLFGILSYFAWPQIAAAVDERERRITANIDAAEAKHEEAKRLLAEHEARLAATAGEVRALLEEARRDAEHTKSSIVADARKVAEDEHARALRDIQRAKEGAIHGLAVTSANTAVDLARKVVRQKLSAEEQNALVRDALGKLTTTAPSTN